jgi:hypothetical protein
MTWTYSQSTGELTHDGVRVGTGYSGAGRTAASGRNNPGMQGIANRGPIPAGQYRIGHAYNHSENGPRSMNLAPVGHNSLGRAGFMIHGNNVQNDASQGCVILGPDLRRLIDTSTDKQLSVVP